MLNVTSQMLFIQSSELTKCISYTKPSVTNAR